VLINLVHEFPRFAALVGDLLNFGIEKNPFGGLDNTLERFPIFKASRFSVSVERLPTIFISLYLGMLRDLDSSSIGIPCLFDTSC